MKLRKTLALLSIIISMIFVLVAVFLRPLWFDIYVFLDKVFPVMPVALGLGLVILGAGVLAFVRDTGWILTGMLLFFDMLWILLLSILFSELGSENVTVFRNAARFLPVLIFAGTVAAVIFWGPDWPWFWKPAIRGMVVIFLVVVAAVFWVCHPWTLRLTSDPIWFYQQDGYAVVWSTNLPSTAELWLDDTPGADADFYAQENGLLTVNDNIQTVFVRADDIAGHSAEIFYSTQSTGVRHIFPTSASKAGVVTANSQMIQLPSEETQTLTFMAFCDIHEQAGLYDRMQSQLDWEGVDLTTFMGDLLNHVDTPQQVTNLVLSLPTGGLNIPRVWVRGNHETRGALARDLDHWFLPDGGHWYFTFSIGETFFIVLDSGEDKEDSHEEYAGLVDFETYHQQQALWLLEVLASDAYQQAEKRIVLVHIPPHEYAVDSFSPVQALLTARTDIDLLIAGHIHEAGFWSTAETSMPFPIATCGGSTESNMAALKVVVERDFISVKIFDVNGSLLREELISEN